MFVWQACVSILLFCVLPLTNPLGCNQAPRAETESDAHGAVPTDSSFGDLFALETEIKPGIEILVEERSELLEGRSVGLITNHTGLASDGRTNFSLLSDIPGLRIVAIFTPEHGLKGEAIAEVGAQDDYENIPVYSLYSENKKPTARMLQGIETLIFDIQDVGARFYTYIWTMAYCMDAAAKNNIDFIVADRPNPIGGRIEGNLLNPSYSSFLSLYPIPVCHGMTIGELAKLFNDKHMQTKCYLTVIPCSGWSRNQRYTEDNLHWVAPSPNMKHLSTAIVYPGTCFFEGTNVSCGRGTEFPFEYIGAPWFNSDAVIKAMTPKTSWLKGVEFLPVEFTPAKPSDMKYDNIPCKGVYLRVTDPAVFSPVRTGLTLLYVVFEQHPGKFSFSNQAQFDLLAGNSLMRKAIVKKDLTSVWDLFKQDEDKFQVLRKEYLLPEYD